MVKRAKGLRHPRLVVLMTFKTQQNWLSSFWSSFWTTSSTWLCETWRRLAYTTLEFCMLATHLKKSTKTRCFEAVWGADVLAKILSALPPKGHGAETWSSSRLIGDSWTSMEVDGGLPNHLWGYDGDIYEDTMRFSGTSNPHYECSMCLNCAVYPSYCQFFHVESMMRNHCKGSEKR